VSSISSRSSSRVFLPGAGILILSGCAALGPQLPLEDVEELTEVPFFPQSDYDCGPAALATVINAAGVTVTPAALIDAVYIEGLKGSLQVELLAATRREGLLPVPVGADPNALLREVASGRPVLVLQNLALERRPAWHYSVVVGYAADKSRFILRSGAQPRRRERAARFLRSWRLADHWGFVAVRPGEIPVSATPDAYMRALLGASAHLAPESAARAYRAALARWPSESLVLFLAAAREHTLDNLDPAAALYRRLLALEPDHAAARNNLANVLLAQGCLDSAAREAEIALGMQLPDGDFVAAISETIGEIEAAKGHSAVCGAI
jgi:hypothetical protein